MHSIGFVRTHAERNRKRDTVIFIRAFLFYKISHLNPIKLLSRNYT